MDKLHHLRREQLVRRPLDEVFAFFASAENLEAITPGFLRFQILTPLPIEMKLGARIEYRLRLGGFPVKWKTVISEWMPGKRFVDEQESGPYAVWRHTHEFEPRGQSTLVRDQVAYREPFGWAGDVAHSLFVRRTVERIFDHRQQRIAALLEGAQDRAIDAPQPA